MEKWNLHKRIALNIISLVGTDKKSMILGFMIATAILSAFLSNTSTSIMMLPIGIAIISQVSGKGVNQESNFGEIQDDINSQDEYVSQEEEIIIDEEN